MILYSPSNCCNDGNNSDEDTKNIILNHLEKIPQIDDKFDDNGKLRSWKIEQVYNNGGSKEVYLFDT